MSVGVFVVEAVCVQGRSCRSVALELGISKSWVCELVKRYRLEGDAGLVPRSKRPYSCPGQLALEIEDEIIYLRKILDDLGVDSGAQTILYHLQKRYGHKTSVATIWRVLKRRGFITPQPQKRPKSSYKRFEALLPNECWQSDFTHWTLHDGSDVEILNFIDDHSRFLLGSSVHKTVKAIDVSEQFILIANKYGLPESVLSDNGAVYTGKYRNGKVVFETLLEEHNIVFKHGQPYHPQTQGKIERWHQTLKLYLAKQKPSDNIEQLQKQIDTFIDYYNTQRPHRSLKGLTPFEGYNKKIKAHPPTKKDAPKHLRVRHDHVDSQGRVTLRYKSKIYTIGIGRPHKNTPVTMTINNKQITITKQDGTIIRELTLNPNKKYQPQNTQKMSTMS